MAARPAARTALKHLQRAAAALQRGAAQDAMREARLALKADPAAVDARAILGIAQVQAGAAEAGLADLESALAARPRDPQLLFNLGHAQSIAGRDAAARKSFEAALHIDPGNLPARMNLAHLHLKADDPKQAAMAFRAALNGAPGMVEAHLGLGLGLALQQQHRLAEAERAFREALRLAPGHPQAAMNLGNLLIDAGRPAEARPLLESAARQPGAGGDAWCNLAVAAYDCGDLAAALAGLDTALQHRPGHTRALATKVIVLDELGRHDEAHALADPALVEQHRLPGLDNAALAAFALAHPTLLEARSGKTTMMGQQTAQLHYGEDPALDALLQAMEAAGTAYRDARCPDPRHPFLAHPPQRWQIVPWVTVLREAGHQESHNHPSGWLSGVYYVAAPGIRRDDNGKTGWLELGRPHARFKARHLPSLDYICPEPGLLVLFPSFAWHRTVPFAGSDPRISIAFDLVPVDMPAAAAATGG